jgi:hypothetical protein
MSTSKFSEYVQDPITHALCQGELSWADSTTSVEDQEMIEMWKKTYGDAIHARVMAKLGQIKLNSLFPDLFPNMVHSEDIHPTTVHSSNNIKTLILRNLPRDIEPRELRVLFELYGVIPTDIYIPRNMDKTSRHFGSIKGFAVIKFKTANESHAVFFAMHNRLEIRDNVVSVEFAKADR